MKWSKQLEQAHWLSYTSENLLNKTIRKKRWSFAWLSIYLGLLLIGLIAWQSSHLKVLGIFEYFGLIGAGMLSLVAVGAFFALWGHNLEKVSKNDGALISLFEATIELFLSWFLTAVTFVFPCGIVWLLIEQIAPLHAWLTAPIYGFLKYRGIRLAGCIATTIPAIYLYIRYTRTKKQIPFLQEALHHLELSEEEAFYDSLELNEEAQRKSWEKLKAQRRAAEQRKATRQVEEGKEE